MLVVHLGVLLDTARRNSETYDEPMYLLVSRSYWATGDFSLNREHPPLTKLLIGIPLALSNLVLPNQYHMDGATQLRFVYELNDLPWRTVWLGRLPMIGLGLLLGWYVYRFGSLYGGPRVGLLALLAYVFQPAITGNTPLAALDLGAAAFPFIALYYLARLREAPSPLRTLVAGFAFGLAQLTKFTSVLLGPVYLVIALGDAVRERSLRPLGRVAALFLVGLTTMFAGYGFEMRTVRSVLDHPRFGPNIEGEVFHFEPLRRLTHAFGERPVPMLTYFKGIDHLKTESADEGHASYFRGEKSKEGWRSYYLVALAVKTPAGILCALALALCAWVALPRRFGLDAVLLLFPVVVLVLFSIGNAQLGIRYVLPALPALAVAVGRLAQLDPARHRGAVAAAVAIALVALPCALAALFPERGPAGVALIAAVALLALLGLALLAACLTRTTDIALRRAFAPAMVALVLGGGAEAMSRHPEHLMFFNVFGGGPDHGWRICSVGDDWGQGTRELARLQRERGWPEIAYDYYGTGVPEIHGLRYRPLNPFAPPPPGTLVAVHVVRLTRDHGNFRWLDGVEPIARANSILVFEVPAAAPEKAKG